MKVLFALFPMGHLGGLINATGHLMEGFRREGHDPFLTEMVWSTHARPSKRNTVSAEWEMGPTGLETHQWTGWSGLHRTPYKGERAMADWRRFANEFDLIVWMGGGPTKRKENIGNTDWPTLFEGIKPKQILRIPDGNLPNACPHIVKIAPYITAVAAVHDAAYTGGAMLGRPVGLIPSPQILDAYPARWKDVPSWEWGRYPGVCSFQTFKGLKHVEDLIRATPFLNPVTGIPPFPVYVAGSGLQYNYMATATDKMPPRYRWDMKRDTLGNPRWHGKTIWGVAEDHGMTYLGVIPESERNRYMLTNRVFVDSSWSHGYAALGGHWNRTHQEAYLNGMILVARDLGAGDTTFQTPGEDYIMSPWNATPAEYAATIEEAVTMPKRKADEMRRRTFEKARETCCARKCARDFIRLSRGDVSECLRGTRNLKKQPSAELVAAGEASFQYFVSGVKSKGGDADE